jgi:enoyl-CoA hydratase
MEHTPAVRYEVEAGVATLTMDRPDSRNALSDELLDALLERFERARRDPGVRCVVLASSHDRVFSAGGDLAGFSDERPLIEKYQGMRRFPELFTTIGGLGKPVLCAVNGYALAGGLGLVLACDLVIAKESARLGAPEVMIGAFPFMISALIKRNLGRIRANELMLLGEQITATEAEALGIVNRATPDADFDAVVAEWAEKLATKSPLLLKLGKDAVERQWDMALPDALDYLQTQLVLAMSTEDLHEGVSAFFAKRDPVWKGR